MTSRDFKDPAMNICVQTDDGAKVSAIVSAVLGCDCLPFSDIPWHKFSAANALILSKYDDGVADFVERTLWNV